MIGAMRAPTACLAVLALAAALVAPGCGDDDDDGSPGSTAATSQPRPLEPDEVAMRNLSFTPARLTVQEGETVTWVNDESIQHTVVAREGADFESGLLDQGDTFEFEADDAGTVRYVCTLHPGMRGTIVVKG